MDFGGSQTALMVIIGPILLLIALVVLVLRVRSAGKGSSSQRTENATHDLYEEEDRRNQDGI